MNRRMAAIEQTVRKRVKRERIQHAVLLGLYATAAVGLIALAPGAGELLRYVNIERMGEKDTVSRRLSQALGRLRDKGLVRIDKAKRRRDIRLTAQGEKLAERLAAAHTLRIHRPKRWDERWRIIIFDVWEKRRIFRDRLRRLLDSSGFVRLQDSVWVYPYDCEEFIAFIKQDLRLGNGVLYLVAEGIENDRWLRRHFKLLKD